MRALSLLGVLVLAKVVVLAGHPVPLSAWTPIAFFWQDILVALIFGAATVFGAADLQVGGSQPVRSRIGWGIYGVLVLYIAINVPVTFVLASPLTRTMMRAAGGPLADSIAYYVTAVNLGSAAMVVGAGAILPWALARVRPRGGRAAVVAGLIVAGLGPLASSRVDTHGFDRNAMTALMPIVLPGVAAAPAPADWRASPMPMPMPIAQRRDDLRRYRGAAKGMNVIVVILESTGARYLRPYGAAEDPMPTVTALSQQAILFEHAYATYPESIKGLFATLCSRYPAIDLSADVHATVPCASMASSLSAAGYHSALFHSGRFQYLGMDAMIQDKGFDVLEDAGAIGGNVHSSFGVDEPATVARILTWIDSLTPGRPFFVNYLPVAGHHPYASSTPGPFPVNEEVGRYRNALHDGDAALATLLAGLRARHLDSRTLLVVFGDHGEAFGQHPGNVGHTLFINEENVKVPYLVAVPGVTTSPTRVAETASLLDTAPTVLDLLGLPARPEHQGTSLLQPGRRMALFFTDYSLGWLGLRDDCWKYQFEINGRRSTLFDVCRDPDETHDVALSESRRVQAYRERVAQWSAAQRTLVARND